MSVLSRIKKKLYFVAARYFRFFANRVLERWSPRVIAITGSVGKTTMLSLIEAELGDRAHYSHDANSAFGISFDLVNLRGVTGSKLRWLYLFFAVPIKSLYVKHSEKFYIVEIDGERPHEAEFLATWLKPEVTLWISLGLSHAIQFEKSVQNGDFTDVKSAITHEFSTLPENTRKFIYLDGDNPAMVAAANAALKTAAVKSKSADAAKSAPDSSTPKIIQFHKSDLRRYAVYPTRTDFSFKNATFHFNGPQPRDLALQLLMLEKLVKYLKVPLRTDLSHLKMAPGRCSYFEGKNGLKIIDSSYNAHLISMASILDMAGRLRAGQKWLVIGDMVDQGQAEANQHRQLADLIAKAHPAEVILIGRRTKKYTAPRLKELGVSVRTTVDPKKALKYIETHTTGDETLIFKGSQYLEWIIEKLLKNPEDADKLCRREPSAAKRRAKWGLT